MRTAYSCVVDGSPIFEWEAVNLCSSLIHNAKIAAQDIKVHVTPSVSGEFLEFVLDRGMSFFPIAPFPGNHGHCNKIRQMFSSAFAGYARAILCDCDLYFLRPPDLDRIVAPAGGRVVGRPQPPLAFLRSLYEAQGLIASPEIYVAFPESDDERTIASNWNGGLYVFDAHQMEKWGSVWAAHAERLLANVASLGPCKAHVDQISWALTVDQLSIAYEHLPYENNYPARFLKNNNYRQTPVRIAALHYHHKMDPLGEILRSGTAELDRQIDTANQKIRETVAARLIRDETLSSLFLRWRVYCGLSQPDRVAATLTRFRNPR